MVDDLSERLAVAEEKINSRSMTRKSYEDGLLEGEINMIKMISQSHTDRLDSHTKRLSILERIVWMFCGVMVFLQTFPYLVDMIESGNP